MVTSSEAKIQALETRIVELEGRGLPSDDQVQRLKDRIWRVAMAYKKSNRWCDEYDRLLKAAGVAPNMRTIVVETMVPAAMNVEVNADLFDRMTPEEQTAYLTGNMTFRQGTVESEVLKIDPVGREARSIQVLSVGVAPAPAPGTAPEGYMLAYTSEEGRVAHYVLDARERYAHSLCGRSEFHWRVNTPARIEHNDDGSIRVCSRCSARAASL